MAYRLAGYLMADAAEAQDAVQEASVRAWRGWAGLREKDRFHAWFSQILVNVCRTRLRQRSRRRTLDLDEFDLEGGGPGSRRSRPIPLGSQPGAADGRDPALLGGPIAG
jgi:DNA-directed RNA polymerase specialized sigma24 family protein